MALEVCLRILLHHQEVCLDHLALASGRGALGENLGPVLRASLGERLTLLAAFSPVGRACRVLRVGLLKGQPLRARHGAAHVDPPPDDLFHNRRYVIAAWALGAKASRRMEVMRAAAAPRVKKRLTG